MTSSTRLAKASKEATGRHSQALTGTGRHSQALTGTGRHSQAVTGTGRPTAPGDAFDAFHAFGKCVK